MKNLYQPEAVAEITTRINSLHPDTPHQWGKMSVDQMFAHCSATLEVASGQKHIPYSFLGKVIGRFLKHMFIDDKPFTKGSPTDKTFVIREPRDFEKEKVRLKGLITTFAHGGEVACTTDPHTFFGKLTPLEWSTGMYKHLDHHLKQFGA